MRKSILMFIAAALVSAGSAPAAAAPFDACWRDFNACTWYCDRNMQHQPVEICRAKCTSIHFKCSIRQEVMIPIDDVKPRPGKLPVIDRPPNGGSGIPAGGILDTVTGMGGGRGPSATGTPLGGGRAPSAPPVIIR